MDFISKEILLDIDEMYRNEIVKSYEELNSKEVHIKNLENEWKKTKKFLYNLAKKYEVKFLLSSYYFVDVE